jgi:hypothetical protein
MCYHRKEDAVEDAVEDAGEDKDAVEDAEGDAELWLRIPMLAVTVTVMRLGPGLGLGEDVEGAGNARGDLVEKLI